MNIPPFNLIIRIMRINVNGRLWEIGKEGVAYRVDRRTRKLVL